MARSAYRLISRTWSGVSDVPSVATAPRTPHCVAMITSVYPSMIRTGSPCLSAPRLSRPYTVCRLRKTSDSGEFRYLGSVPSSDRAPKAITLPCALRIGNIRRFRNASYTLPCWFLSTSPAASRRSIAIFCRCASSRRLRHPGLRIAETEPGRFLRRDAALLDVAAARLAFLVREVRREPPRRPVEDARDVVAGLARLRDALLRLELDPGFFRESAQRLDERLALDPHHEIEHRAARAAPEAFEELLLRVDVERRRLLVVERAAGLQVAACPLELDVPGDDRHDVGRGSHSLDVVLEIADHASGTISPTSDARSRGLLHPPEEIQDPAGASASTARPDRSPRCASHPARRSAGQRTACERRAQRLPPALEELLHEPPELLRDVRAPGSRDERHDRRVDVGRGKERVPSHLECLRDGEEDLARRPTRPSTPRVEGFAARASATSVWSMTVARRGGPGSDARPAGTGSRCRRAGSRRPRSRASPAAPRTRRARRPLRPRAVPSSAITSCSSRMKSARHERAPQLAREPVIDLDGDDRGAGATAGARSDLRAPGRPRAPPTRARRRTPPRSGREPRRRRGSAARSA